MNMVPPQNLNGGAYAYGGFDFGYNSNNNNILYREKFGVMNRFEGGYNHENHDYSESCKKGGSDPRPSLLMVEDESRSNSLNETGSSSKDFQVQDKGWLRLSIGGGCDVDQNKHHPQQESHQIPTRRRGFGFGLTELDLLPMPLPASSNVSNFSTPFILPQPLDSDVNWALRPISHNNNNSLGIGIGIGTSSMSSYIPYGSSPTFQFHTATGLDFATSDTFRVIDPPRRPHSGIWFTLQPLQNQGKLKQPVLPQRSSSTSTSYLRIKDGRMTVRLLIKYLVNKLRLDSESEIEIRCRGEKLEPCLTMQHIRDNIWCSKDSFTLLPHSSTIDHVMVLHYAPISTSTPTPPPSN